MCAKFSWKICLGNYLKALALWSRISNLLQTIFHYIYWIFIGYYIEYLLNNLEYWRWKTKKYRNLLENWLDITLFQNNAKILKRNVFWWRHVRGTRMQRSLIIFLTLLKMIYYHLGYNFIWLISSWYTKITLNNIWFFTIQFWGCVYNNSP